MKKKLLSLMLAGSMLASSAACSSSKSSESVQPTTNEAGKTILTIGIPNDYPALTTLIDRYNDGQDKYALELIDYSKITGNIHSVENDSTDEEMSQLKLDIASGKIPDILCLSTKDMLPLISKGTFTDMYELMEKYDGIKREEILPNVLEGFEIDGKLPVLASDFYIDTAIAKTKFTGEASESWDMEKFIETASGIPDDMNVLKNTSFMYDWYGVFQDNRQNISGYALRKVLNESVDMISYTCDFNSEALKNALSFALSFPDKDMVKDHINSMTDKEADIFFKAEQRSMLDDKALISSVWIIGLASSAGSAIWGEFGDDDLTFVGYPSENGCGAVTGCEWLYGITESSDNKEAAWSFLSTVINDEKFNSIDSQRIAAIPVSRTLLEKLYNKKDTSDKNSVYSSESGVFNKPITQERVDQLYNYILSAKIEPYHDSEIEAMIAEETAYVLNGERTPEQCIDILNDRVGTYLAERK